MEIREVGVDHPDAVKLIAEVQQEYVLRYGGPDGAPMDSVDFAPPHGRFFLGYVDDVAVASGGWCAHSDAEVEFRAGDAELKRMFVVASMRGRGLARKLLSALENSAAAAGRRRMVLSTGSEQPEAIALYRSVGYLAMPTFGMYRDAPECRCFEKDLRR